ncbi:MAG: hypothetical protein NT049_11975, partial [Planctomycetota bacterium]|nr:hypothetical protein [Planctomycetota bacterium]
LIALVVFLVLVGVWLGVQMLFYYPVVPIGAEATLLALTHSAAVFALWVLACVICWMLFRRAANI